LTPTAAIRRVFLIRIEDGRKLSGSGLNIVSCRVCQGVEDMDFDPPRLGRDAVPSGCALIYLLDTKVVSEQR
jgi:hypothetical protein